MMEPADSFEHAGLAVRIRWEEYIDENDNPRTNQDGNLGVMFAEYDRYNLGDEDAPDPREQTIECPVCNGAGFVIDPEGEPDNQEDCPKCEGEGEVSVGIVEYLKREHGARVILPLFVYEHGGITMSCGGRLDKGEDDFDRHGRFVPGDGWDTSSVGVIFDTAETREAAGVEDFTDERIQKNLEEEVLYYATYLEGFVFGYEVIEPELDEDGEFDPETCEGEQLDSCWGFLEPNIHSGESYVHQAAREAAEGCRERIELEKLEAHRWACADVVTK